MRTCSLCEADLSELELPDGRCPVCGSMVSWPEKAGGQVAPRDPREDPSAVAADFAPAATGGSAAGPADASSAIAQIAATIVERARAAARPTADAAGPQTDRAAEPSEPAPSSVAAPPPPATVGPAGPTSIDQTIKPRPRTGVDARQLFEIWQRTVQVYSGLRSTHSIKSTAPASAREVANLVIQNRSVRRAESPPQAAPADYELLEVIGEGGVGVVYAARQASINRTVAVKMLKHEAAAPEQRQAFLSEAVVTGDLDHPNIVPIYDLGGNEEGMLFYSMKRVRGTPWADALATKTRAENLEILLKVADAVAFAHARGVVHRDLKPQNVMLGDFGEVLVLDWGIALSRSMTIHSGTAKSLSQLAGTPAYMAPEMATGPVDRIGPASDIYLLGGILFEILAGQPPHGGTTVWDCLEAAAANRLQPCAESSELLDVAYRALATEPEDRFASVQEFQAAIRECQSHAESQLLSARAEQRLGAALVSGDYQEYAQAAFGFQEALAQWSGNQEARRGLSRAQGAYAEAALRKGDCDLGLSLLSEREPEHADLRARLLASRRERDARHDRLRRVRRVAQLLAVTVFLVICAAFLFSDQARRAAQQANREAQLAREDALHQADEARRERERADQKAAALTESERHLRDERNRALQARAEAEAARDTAETARRDAEAAQEREEAQGYLARIGLASEKIADNAFGDALRILQAYATGKQASRRHWEWGRLRWLCALDSLSVEAEDRVESLAVAPGGKWVVTGHGDGGVRIWEAQQAGPPRRRLQLAHPVLALAISPDAQFLAAADGARIQLWQLDQGDQADAPRHTLSGHRDDVLSLAFAPQGDRLLSGARDGASALWRWPSDGAPAHVVGGHHGPVWSVAFAPDGQSFLTASEDAKVILWQIANPSKKIFRGHRSAVYCAAFSPDGRYIASGDYDGRVLVWEPNLLAEDIVALQRRLDAGPSGSRPPDGTRRDDVLPPHLNANSATGPQNDDAGVRVLAGHTDAVRSIVFARDGRWVLSGSHDHTVRAWNWSQDLQERNAVRILRGHGGWVRACAFLRDGNAAVSAGDDRQLKYWDIHSYEERRVLEGHRDAILRAAFAPDGQTLVTASRDHAARLWGVADRRSTRLEEGHAYLAQRALFTQDGKMLLTAAFDNTVLKWDRATGGQMPFETAQRLEGVGRNGVMALSHDGQWLLTASDENAARLWDARTGRLLQTLEGHRDEVTAVAFAPGDALAFTGDAKGRGLLWRRADASGPWQQAAELQGHRQGLRINAARFLPDGRRLLTASADHTVAQWDVVRAEEQKPLVLAHPDAVTLLAVAPSGQLALTACADRRVRLWDVDRAVSVILDNGQARPENERIDAVAFAPDGRQALVLWGGAQELQLYAWPAVPALEEAPTRRVLRGPFGAASAALFTPEGTQVLTVGGDGARLWNVQAGLQRVATYRPHGAVSAADFSSDGRYVLTGGWDGAVKIWDLHQTPPVVILKLENPHAGRAVQAAVFSPGARSLAQQRILTVGDDGTAKLWDVDLPGKRYALHAVQKPHSLCIRSAAFAPDGSWIVTASDDGTAKLWPAEGDGAAIVLRGHRQPVLSAAFAPATSAGSARPLVVTGSSDRTAIVWQIDWQQKTATAQTVLAGGHTASVLAVAFSPDGRRVLTGGEDNLAKLWETSSGREILTLKYHRQEVTAVAFSPDGRLALTASGDGEAVLWPALDWCPDAEVPP